jgi:hypothetical protein
MHALQKTGFRHALADYSVVQILTRDGQGRLLNSALEEFAIQLQLGLWGLGTEKWNTNIWSWI